jgi:hypothetical protein
MIMQFIHDKCIKILYISQVNFTIIEEKHRILCNCSLGTQKRIYESLFDRKVNVKL